MEVRSSRRMRILVTQMAGRGLSVNEIARALISMVAPSMTRSNQRPNTLMQDRSPPVRQRLLQRTAGPYIWVISRHCPVKTRCRFLYQVGRANQSPRLANRVSAGKIRILKIPNRRLRAQNLNIRAEISGGDYSALIKLRNFAGIL